VSGLAQATLSRWLKEASTFKRKMPPKDEEKAPAKQLQEWTPEEKFALVLEAASITEAATVVGSKRVKELERELARKDKKLAEAAALALLQKQVQVLFGDEDDDTEPKKDK
jgi:transposase